MILFHHTLHRSLALLLCGVLLVAPLMVRAQEGISLFSMALPGMAEPFRTMAIQLAHERCWRQEAADMQACVTGELSVYRSTKEDELREALLRKVLVNALDRSHALVPHPVVSQGLQVDPATNYFSFLTQAEAKLVYHDMVQCYFTIGMHTVIHFYLDKATGVSDSDHPGDVQMPKEDIYGVDRPDPTYCARVYDESPLISKAIANPMTTLQTTLLASVRESRNLVQDQGFATIIADSALLEMERYHLYLYSLEPYSHNTHLPNLPRQFYAPAQPTTANTQAYLSQERAERSTELVHSQQALLRTLQAFQNFEATFPVHIQYRKMITISEELRKKIRGIRLGWKFLHVKFDNASIEGGAR